MKYNYEIDQILITDGDGGGVGVTVADLAWHEGSVPVPGSTVPGPATLHPSHCGIARVDRDDVLYRTENRTQSGQIAFNDQQSFPFQEFQIIMVQFIINLIITSLYGNKEERYVKYITDRH